MAKIKAVKVRTPGSQSQPSTSGAQDKLSPGRGRPKKATIRKGVPKKDNYRSKYALRVLDIAVNAVREKKMSIREAAKEYKVPRSTICDRIRGKKETLGRPTEMTADEERLLVKRLMMMGNWGYPLTTRDMCYLIKDYLDGQGRNTRFVNNRPGVDFVKGFLKRHTALSKRRASLIKRARAQVSWETVDAFFDYYEKTAEEVPAKNVFNYDETNLRDDPGAVKAIFKKGIKYAEQVGDHSKSAISVMFCGSAAGQLLPPYVVYKGANTYPGWCKNGPAGSVYTATKSGWFDAFAFRDCFEKIFLPHLKRLEGKKVLIGDNLSSHLSVEVIEQCRMNNIEFVCLPPNATDKMQPLDVGVFGPMKNSWKKMLRNYRRQDPAAKLLQKTQFPRMLLELLETLVPEEILPPVR